MVRETRLAPSDFILPLFVKAGTGHRDEIVSMPGVFQLSVDEAVREAERAATAGLSGVLLFGLPEHKDAVGSSSADDTEAVQRATRAIKDAVPEIAVVTDVCLCEYTDHGHCGYISARRRPRPRRVRCRSTLLQPSATPAPAPTSSRRRR